ncbi:hypothetical protein GCM10010252_26940 [Streptomyces aureoverticillatus]|nr:hypothetical protein GCM10010252_26940 [Streptomyces aureoverticillatus]
MKFEVAVCPQDDPSEWEPIALATTNTTGHSLGYFLESPKLRVMATGENARTKSANYMGSFTLKDCVPFIEWPCSKTHKIQVSIAVVYNKAADTSRVIYGSEIGVPPGLQLHTTP